MEFIPIFKWGFNFPEKKPLVIAGPCSAESKEQMLLLGTKLASSGVHLIRAGIWKPRSRPDSFQGIGLKGLEWLKEASSVSGLPVTTEVATPQHVEQALKAGIDILWLGARTTVNPFYVQEIAEALKGVDIPIMVKNPINPDIELWVGSIERLYQTGLRRIAAIHRGFSIYKAEIYRNPPMWEIPIELRRRFTDLPIICDPSHITGNKDLVANVSQRAMDLDFDGLMIETHADPLEALSDSDQQLTPEELNTLLTNLILRNASTADPGFMTHLESLRLQIDGLDKDIIDLLAKRMAVSREIGAAKKENGVAIFQMNRWAQLFDNRVQTTIKAGLSDQFATDFIQSIHKESIRQQTEVMNNEEDKS